MFKTVQNYSFWLRRNKDSRCRLWSWNATRIRRQVRRAYTHCLKRLNDDKVTKTKLLHDASFLRIFTTMHWTVSTLTSLFHRDTLYRLINMYGITWQPTYKNNNEVSKEQQKVNSFDMICQCLQVTTGRLIWSDRRRTKIHFFKTNNDCRYY